MAVSLLVPCWATGAEGISTRRSVRARNSGRFNPKNLGVRVGGGRADCSDDRGAVKRYPDATTVRRRVGQRRRHANAEDMAKAETFRRRLSINAYFAGASFTGGAGGNTSDTEIGAITAPPNISLPIFTPKRCMSSCCLKESRSAFT